MPLRLWSPAASAVIVAGIKERTVSDTKTLPGSQAVSIRDAKFTLGPIAV